MMNTQKTCLQCKQQISGRKDKKFCDDYCRGTYHYLAKRDNPKNSFFISVKKQLQLNRKILKQFNQGGKVTVRQELLFRKGFNPKFFTHYWRSKS
ncbi:MAG: hypothetical protein AAGK97_17795, partial [Bacteroidota bacterium]